MIYRVSRDLDTKGPFFVRTTAQERQQQFFPAMEKEWDPEDPGGNLITQWVQPRTRQKWLVTLTVSGDVLTLMSAKASPV